MTDTAVIEVATEPVTTCGTCGQSDTAPKHTIVVGYNNEATGGVMFHAHDADRDGAIHYHFDCRSEWHDLGSRLVTQADPEAHWPEEAAAEASLAVERNARIIEWAASGIQNDDLRQRIRSLDARGGAGGIDQTFANSLLTGSTGGGFPTVTAPMHLRLMTGNGSDTVAGTELGTSGGYTAGGSSISSWAAAASGSIATSAAVTWTNMPAGPLTGVEVWDSGGTPKRTFWGPWTGGAITLGSGNSLTVANGALTEALA